MSTPVARSPLNVYEGASADDLNQLLGTHAPIVIYAPSVGATPLISAGLNGCSFAEMFPLADSTGSYAVDQPFTMSGTVLDRVVLPMSIAAGLGNDLLVGLYADSAGNPVGPPLAAAYVPKEFLQPSPCADNCGIMLSPWQSGSPNTTLPANLAALRGQGFIDDGAANIFSIGGWDLTTPQTYVVSAPFTSNGLGAWTQTAPLPIALADVGIAFGASTIIVAGGFSATSTPVNTVYTAQSSATGTVAAWAAQTVLPQTLANCSVAVIGNTNVYVIGGNHTGTTSVTTVYSAPIATGGVIGAWSTPAGSQLPVALDTMQVVQIAGWLVILGGNTNGSWQATVWAAPINTTTNTIGSWRPWPTWPAGAGWICNAWVAQGNIIVSCSDGTMSLAVNAGGPANSWVVQAFATTGYPHGSPTVVNNTIILIGQNSTIGSTAFVNSVPTVSVPLHATGLVNATKYHVTVQQTDAYSQVNVTQCALTGMKPSAAFFLAAAGNLSSALTVTNIGVDLLSGLSWNTNSVNCNVSTPVEVGLGQYDFQSTASGGAYSFSTPVGANGFLLPPAHVVYYSIKVQAASGAGQTVTSIVNFYNSAGVGISSSAGASGSTSGAGCTLAEGTPSPALTAYATIVITISGGNPGDVTSFYVSFVQASNAYVPLSLYVSGKTSKPMHVCDDFVNLQPSGYNTIAYDYAGKPVHYGESVLPLVNLMSPNYSNFGGLPTGGTTAALALSNATKQILSYSSHLPLASASVPAFPSPNPMLQSTLLFLQSVAAGDMYAWTSTGTSGIPVVAGQSYTAFAYFVAGGAASSRNCIVNIWWYQASGAACAHGGDAGAAVADANPNYVQAYVNAVAPATAAYATVALQVQGTGAALEGHGVNLISFALDNSLVNGLATPNLAYFDPQYGPGGTHTFLQLVYDPATSVLLNVVDISGDALQFFGTGQTATYTATGMTDTQATWPMNGLVGQVITAPASITNASGTTTTTAIVAFNIGNTIVLTAAGWSNGQPTNASQYSIT